MKVLLSVALLLAVVAFAASATSVGYYENMFAGWMNMNGKTYDSEEFQKRFQIFKDNARFIEAFNKKNVSFTLAINQFADLHVTEFNRIYKGLKTMDRQVSDINTPVTASLPDSWDWRSKGAVTAVKNQQQCGSCWSFSTTGSVEGARAIGTSKLISLSEQQLVDCSGTFGNQGCNGGWMDSAFKYIISNGGLDTEASYPYTAQDGTCNYQAANCATTIGGFQDVPAGDEGTLLQFVYAGPTSVAIDASKPSFQFYSSGVYYEPSCSTTALDHGVLAVGYGAASGQKYWIVKNSWGASWGMSGYIWMSRERSNNCGIASAASQPNQGTACKTH